MNRIVLLLLKVVLTLVGSTFFLMGCKKEKIEFTVDRAYWDSIDKVKLQEIVESNFLDTVNIKKQLALRLPTSPILINGVKKNIPFLYNYQINNNDNITLQWTLGDLYTQDSEMSISFANIIDYKNNRTGAGSIFFICNDNPKAVTMAAVLKEISEFAKVLYYDEDSMIYINDDMIRCLSFKFYSDEGLYAVYYDDTTFKLRDEGYLIKLYYIIDNLRIAKAFWKDEVIVAPKDFKGYTDVLNPMMRVAYLELRDSFEEEILNLSITSEIEAYGYNLLKFDNNVKQFWDKVSQNKLGQEFTLDRKVLTNDEYTKLSKVSILYKDKNTIVFKYLSPYNKEEYSFIKRGFINNEQVLFTNKDFFYHSISWDTLGMTMFYLRMLESLPELK